MKNSVKQLHFNLHYDRPSKSCSVGVVLDGQEIYRVKDFVHLSKSLGLQNAPQTPAQLQNLDENDNHVFPSADCFQSKITEYVFKNCAQFSENYNEYFAGLVGSCEFKGMADNVNCKQCYRNSNADSA